jgi:hypothetical protein
LDFVALYVELVSAPPPPRHELRLGECPPHTVRRSAEDVLRGGRVRLDRFVRFLGDEPLLMLLPCPSVV